MSINKILLNAIKNKEKGLALELLKTLTLTCEDYTTLHTAAIAGEPDVCEALMKAGVAVDSRDQD